MALETITFCIEDELYEKAEQIAAQRGRTVEDLSLEWLLGYASKLPATEPKDCDRQE
jgi:hypothetical protein